MCKYLPLPNYHEKLEYAISPDQYHLQHHPIMLVGSGQDPYAV